MPQPYVKTALSIFTNWFFSNSIVYAYAEALFYIDAHLKAIYDGVGLQLPSVFRPEKLIDDWKDWSEFCEQKGLVGDAAAPVYNQWQRKQQKKPRLERDRLQERIQEMHEIQIQVWFKSTVWKWFTEPFKEL